MDTEMKMNQLTFSKKKDGSLLEMFESPAFETQMIFKYLQTTTRPCIVQYLMNKLYRENRNDIKLIDFYFPQICKLAISRKKELSVPLERFIL